MSYAKRSLTRLFITLAVFGVIGFCLYQFGRSIWYPVVVKCMGGRSNREVVDAIRTKKSYLSSLPAGKQLTILAYKSDKFLDVFYDNTLIMTIPILAASGGTGPKIKEGDRQVPEGIYTIDVLNPNSSYYLSMRISYPNETDRKRSQARGVTNPGGDIYIHGKAASIGCIAIGDDKIEDLYYLANLAGLQNTKVVIAPAPKVDYEKVTDNEIKQLYKSVYAQIDIIKSGSHTNLLERASAVR
jgi:murein L,D-transpeptidase YafK